MTAPPRLFIAAFAAECNSFSPFFTGLQEFEDACLFYGDATKHPANLFTEPLHVWRGRGESLGANVVESIGVFAQPSGPLTKSVYEMFRDRLLSDLQEAPPVDIVLLNLHGAMLAVGYDDCEGDVLQRVREIVGPDVVVGVELDLHCHVTEQMRSAVTFMITYKEYPHTDVAERAHEVFDIAHQTWMGICQPHTTVFDCRMVSKWPTTMEPNISLVRYLKELESPAEVLSVSFAHGFPFGDTPDTGAKIVVVTNNRPDTGRVVAENVFKRLWQSRHASTAKYHSLDQALHHAEQSVGCTVVADISDNAGSGAASDSTYFLSRIIETGFHNAAIGFFWDPIAVRFCHAAGEGQQIQLRLGGKCSRFSGQPVDINVRVKKVIDDAVMPFSTSNAFSLGRSVWLRHEALDLDLFVSTHRHQVLSEGGFGQFGWDIHKKAMVVVKSQQHFYRGFEHIVDDIIYASVPGGAKPDYKNLPYQKLTRPVWPRVENPFGEPPEM